MRLAGSALSCPARLPRTTVRTHDLRSHPWLTKLSGIIDPPIDDLLSKVDSKYQLVIFASKRARQINDYYADLHEGSLFDNVGPLVDSSIDDKPLSVAHARDQRGQAPCSRPLGRVARRAPVTAQHRRRHHRRHRRVQGRRRRAGARARRARRARRADRGRAALRRPADARGDLAQPGAHRPLRGRRRGAPRRDRPGGRPHRDRAGDGEHDREARRRASPTTCSATPCSPATAPVVIAPAMHTEMWQQPGHAREHRHAARARRHGRRPGGRPADRRRQRPGPHGGARRRSSRPHSRVAASARRDLDGRPRRSSRRDRRRHARAARPGALPRQPLERQAGRRDRRGRARARRRGHARSPRTSRSPTPAGCDIRRVSTAARAAGGGDRGRARRRRRRHGRGRRRLPAGRRSAESKIKKDDAAATGSTLELVRNPDILAGLAARAARRHSCSSASPPRPSPTTTRLLELGRAKREAQGRRPSRRQPGRLDRGVRHATRTRSSSSTAAAISSTRGARNARCRWPTASSTWSSRRLTTAARRRPRHSKQHESDAHERTPPLHLRVRHRGPPRQDLRPDLATRSSTRCSRVDPHSRVAVETLVTTGLVHVAGEVTTDGLRRDPGDRARARSPSIGYDSSDVWFDGRSCGVSVSIGGQSPDIAQGVDNAFETREGASDDALDQQGAGDQGIMFGYATRETPELMPLPIWLAHRLAERLAAVRKAGRARLPAPRRQDPGHDRLRRAACRAPIETVVLSTQHSPAVSTEQLRAEVEELVIRPVLDTRRARPARARACSSTPPAGSRSAGRRATPDSPAARSSSTPTAARAGTAAARSAARTRRRSTARPRTRCAGSRRTPSRRASPTGSRCRSPTRSARPRPSGSTSRRSAPAHVPDERDHRRDPRGVRPAPGRDHPRPRPAAPDLRADGELRPLRPRAARLHLGAARPRRRPARRRRALTWRAAPSPGCSSTRRCRSSTSCSTTAVPERLARVGPCPACACACRCAPAGASRTGGSSSSPSRASTAARLSELDGRRVRGAGARRPRSGRSPARSPTVRPATRATCCGSRSRAGTCGSRRSWLAGRGDRRVRCRSPRRRSTAYAPGRHRGGHRDGRADGARRRSRARAPAVGGTWVGAWARDPRRTAAAHASPTTGRRSSSCPTTATRSSSRRRSPTASTRVASLRTDARQPGADRYRGFLARRATGARVIVGNRSTVYAPAHASASSRSGTTATRCTPSRSLPTCTPRDAALVRQEQQARPRCSSRRTPAASRCERLVEIGWVHDGRRPRAPRRPQVIPTEQQAAADEPGSRGPHPVDGLAAGAGGRARRAGAGAGRAARLRTGARVRPTAVSPRAARAAGARSRSPRGGGAPRCVLCGTQRGRLALPELRRHAAARGDRRRRAAPPRSSVAPSRRRASSCPTASGRCCAVDAEPALVVATRGAEPIADGRLPRRAAARRRADAAARVAARRRGLPALVVERGGPRRARRPGVPRRASAAPSARALATWRQADWARGRARRRVARCASRPPCASRA